MELGSKLTILSLGGGLILLGAFILWRVSRYDLKGMVWVSARDVVLRRRTDQNQTAIEAKWREINDAGSAVGKVRRAATTAAGHFIAQALGIAALVIMAAGGALAAFGLFFR